MARVLGMLLNISHCVGGLLREIWERSCCAVLPVEL